VGRNAASRMRSLGAKAIGALLTGLVLGAGLSLSVLAWSLLEVRDRQLFLAATDSVLPWVALFGALSLGCLAFSMIRMLVAFGRRASARAERITDVLRGRISDLAEAQRVAQEVIEALPNPIYFKAANGRHIGADEAWHPGTGFPVKGELLRPLRR